MVVHQKSVSSRHASRERLRNRSTSRLRQVDGDGCSGNSLGEISRYIMG